MGIILDIIVLAMIGGSAYWAYRKGLIKSLFSLVGGIGAIALAVALHGTVAEGLRTALFSEMNMMVAKAASFLVLIALCYAGLFVASRLLDVVFRVLPLGKKANKIGGIIVGVIRGLIFALIFGVTVYNLSKGEVLISTEDVENTFLLRWLNQLNPLIGFLK